jgi:LysR family transcriptional regulator, mexEF-oprN operon transcriptional activator
MSSDTDSDRQQAVGTTSGLVYTPRAQNFLNRIDLNLLTVFSAMLDERSVSRAAAKLHVTQPAISNALSRLRDLIGDPLFIKTKKGMEPTERAVELQVPVRAALEKIYLAVENARPFDPATSVAEVSIACDEYSAHLFLPAVAQDLAMAAPGLTLHIRRAARPGSAAARDASANHFVFAEPGNDPDQYSSIPLVEEGWKLVARRDHPMIAGKLTAAQYAALPSVVPWFENSATTSWVDAALKTLGLKRHAAARIATPSPIVFAGCDFVMIVPATMARIYADVHGLAVHELPFEGPPYRTDLYWHRDYDAAPMHRWVRERAVAVCQAVVRNEMQPSAVGSTPIAQLSRAA